MLGRIRLALVFMLFAACSGSPTDSQAKADGVLKALAAPSAVEILALHPYPHELERDASEMERFHGYGILGQATLADAAAQTQLMALLESGIEDSDGRVAACFNPRHGIRATASGSVWEFVICFECLSMKVYRDGEQVDGHRTSERYASQVTAIFRGSGLTIHQDQ